MTTPGQVVRLKRAGHVFEVLTNPGAVTAWRAKPDSPADLNSMLISPVIFANQSKGLRASSAALITAFETDANDECIRLILKTGELQVSASERHDKVELCKKQIIAALHKGYIDPRTQLPHPLIRIESAASGVKGWKPDPEKPIPVQVRA
uniref:Ribosome maturation protein SDO1/SBDS N-terminal domain-containing protein n=1 Tax=Spongospora subterranea TaxID=70186 RepID=A0A0H5QWX9_9EUKA|eukprot:CRZ06242.1 hypothetical protein [Spongospora subterranea]